LSRQQLDERFLIYSALTSANTSLWLSYPKGDEEGKSLLPSEVIRQLKGYFSPYLIEVTLGGYKEQGYEEDVLSSLSHPQADLPQLIARLRMYHAGIPIARAWWEVLGWYKTQPDWRDQMASLLQSLEYKNKTIALAPITSQRLYGKVLRTSVSRMEKFSACPFSHFASYGLGLRERKVFALKAPDIGQLFHAALSKIALILQEQGKSWGLLSEEECWQQAEEVVDALVPKLQGQILLSSKRYGYITRKLKNIVGRASVILGEQSKRASFEPIGLELDFGPGRPLPPLTFQLPNGYVMEIVGRIDRVDVAESEQGLLLRVIDYKSSQTDLKLHEVYYGLSLQMLTYLDVLLRSAEAWLGQSALPAGTLYFHVHNPLLQNSNHISEEQAKLEMLKAFKMKGLVLADREVIAKMDAPLEKGYSDILPVALKTDGGFYSSASVATLEQWETLLSNARGTIETIGTRITDGDVEIYPYRLGTETACTHCAYRAVCQFDDSMEGNEYHLLRSKNKNQMWELLDGIEKEVKSL
jgi:ATP-dependent helicase/nuclease subunit B